MNDPQGDMYINEIASEPTTTKQSKGSIGGNDAGF